MKLFAPLIALMLLVFSFAVAQAAVVMTDHEALAGNSAQSYDMQFFSGPNNFTISADWNQPNRHLQVCAEGSCVDSVTGHVELSFVVDCSTYCNIPFAVYNLAALNATYNLAVDKH